MPLVSPKRGKQTLLIVTVVALLILAGIFVATQIDITKPVTFTSTEGRPLIITELTLGALLTPDQAARSNPKLRQAASYPANEPLALRVTTDPSVNAPFTVSVRLLTENGQVIELTPSQATFQPGTSTFCCWQVEHSGTFTFQVFRPEKVITSLPLVISPGGGNPPRL